MSAVTGRWYKAKKGTVRHQATGERFPQPGLPAAIFTRCGRAMTGTNEAEITVRECRACLEALAGRQLGEQPRF